MSAASSAHTLRPRTRTAPSFPRDREQRDHQQTSPQPSTQQIPISPQTFFIPNNNFLSDSPLNDLEAWRLHQSFQAAAMNGHPPPRRTTSRGPRAQSPIDPSAAKIFVWDSSTSHFSPSSRPQFRRKSVTSNTSSSDHHHLRSPRPSRSPSPAAPRASSNCARPSRTPMTHEFAKRPITRKMTGQSNAGSNNSNSGCVFETALVNSRRRIPYSVGSESLAAVPPGSYQSRLNEKDERCLSVDILDLYHVCLFVLCHSWIANVTYGAYRGTKTVVHREAR